MSKTHYTLAETPASRAYRFMAPTVCGRDAYSTRSTSATTCLNCKKQPEFKDAVMAAGLAEAEAFANQTPRTVRNPWSNTDITCKCGHNLFRDNGRSLDRYNHVCAACGTTTHTLTETGMSA
jgi:hypothetical protein